MKKFLLLAGVAAFAMNANAQVSKTPENKKFVLEEFTGIHCGYCPDGHKRANDLANQYPGKVLLVNVHAGSFAVPGAGEPDFRTTAGDAFDVTTGGGGYPKGMVNRAKPTNVMSGSVMACDRGQWASEATKIMAQTAPVNVSVKSKIDPKTRVLTTEVEVYYTSASAQSTNYLTVELLEDGILAYQSDYGNYNPTNWVTIAGVKYYKHNHMLRMVLSGDSYGDKIDTTTSGYYMKKTYTTTIPATLKGVPVKFSNLSVVAFVNESKLNILNGAETKVDFDASLKTDLKLTDLTTPPSGMCLTSIHPKVEVTNNYANDVTSFDVTCTVNGVDHVKSYSGTLKNGEKTTVDFGDIAFTSGGTYTVSLGGFSKINSDNLFDIDASNDMASISGLGFTKNAMTTVDGKFEAGKVPANFALDQSANKSFAPVYSTTGAIGAKNTYGAIRYSIHSSWNVSGVPGPIYFGEVNLASMSAPYLTYYYAYSDKGNGTATGQYGGTAPTIKTEVSEDCGVNWTTIRTVTCTETGQPASGGAYYIPTSSQYVWVGTPLASYAGKSVLVRISGVPGTGGNALYIDEISMAQATAIDDNKIEDTYNMNVYPNPAADNANINFTLAKPNTVSVTLMNTLGQQMSTVLASQKLSAGDYKYSVNTSSLPTGIYIVNVVVDGKTYTKHLSVVN